MHRRLRDALHRFAFGLRRGVAEIIDLLTLPFRVFRPRTFGNEMMQGGRDALALGSGAVRGTIGTVVSFLWLLIRLPWIILRFLAYDGPYRLLVWLQWNSPKRVALAVGGLAGLLLVLGGSLAYMFFEKRYDFQRSIHWRRFEHFVQSTDIAKAEAELVDLHRLLPKSANVAARLEAIRTRNAPAGDPTLVRLLMRTHYREQRVDLAAKEAIKLLETAPDDWEAHLFLTHDAFNRGDKEAVRKYLAAMPRPQDVPDSIPLWGVPYSLRLFQQLGETARYDQMVEFVTLSYLPLLRNKDVPFYDPGVKLILLDCYHHALTQFERRPQLTEYWDPLAKAVQSILRAEDLPVADVVRLGQYVEFQLVYLEEFARLKRITQEDRVAMAAEVEGRLKVIWDRVQSRDAKNPAAYLGLSLQRFRANDAPAAVRIADEGLQACGVIPELIAFKGQYLRAIDPQAALAYFDTALKQVELTPTLCKIWAETAFAGGRLDQAREACQQALKLQADVYWARRYLGEINSKQGLWTAAVAALDPVKKALIHDPEGCRLYVRACQECGLYQDAEEFLQQVQADKRPVELILQAARALQQTERHDEAIRWARQVLDRDANDARANWLIADSLRVLAEQGDRDWNRSKIREAINHYAAVRKQQPNNLVVANNMAWLELKALGQKEEPYETAAPLRAVQDEPHFPAEFMETLGAIYVERGEYEQAAKLLERAVGINRSKPSFWYHLALAHHGLKHRELAEGNLWRAAQQQMTPRERAEYDEICKTIRGGR